MNKIRVFSLIILFLVSASLCSATPSSGIPEPDVTVHEIMDETINTLRKKYKMNPCGIGMNGKFEYLEISFQVRRILSKDEIRDMLFECSEEFLKNINSNEMIRSYLKNYPFSYKNAGIVFFISDEKGYDLLHPNICVAGLTRSGLDFSTNNPENTLQFKETTRETHEEAIKLVREYREKKQP